MSLASDRPEFVPPKTSGHGRAIGLAVLAHAFLIAALTWGVGWKREATNAPVQAELWSTTVQQAAPALVEPTPPPPQIEPKPEPKVEPPPPLPKPSKPVKVVEPEPEPEPKIDPQIAIEKAKKEEKKKLEKKKADEAKEKAKALAKKEAEEKAAEEAKLAAQDKKKRALEAQKLEAKKLEAKKAAAEAATTAQIEAQRKINLDKMMKGLAGASGGETATGTAKQSTGPSAGYAGRVSARVKPNIVFTAEVSGNIEAGVEVRTSPDGTIIGRKIIKSSGNKAWDEAVLRALDKTEILPKDTDGRVPSTLEMYFKPKDLL